MTDEFSMDKILPMLKTMGMSPDQLGPDKLKLIQKLAESITNPEDIGTEQAAKLLRDLGVNFSGKKKPLTGSKTPRNSLCSCGSGKKYKKCCIVKKEII